MKKKTKSKVKLLKYSMAATIPTGAYANIRPEITVKADTLENAEKFVMPYIEKLFAKYRESPVQNVPFTTTSTNDVTMPPPTTPNMSQSFNRASQAVVSCMSLEALELIKNQIIKSVKLTDAEKIGLQTLVLSKSNEFKPNENNIPKQL